MPGTAVEISAAPVTWTDYARFARETGRRVPKQRGAATKPVTQVSAAGARAFAEWLL